MTIKVSLTAQEATEAGNKTREIEAKKAEYTAKDVERATAADGYGTELSDLQAEIETLEAELASIIND